MTTPMALPALDNTMGALFVGLMVATALWGVSCVQAFNYFTGYAKDSWSLKMVVAAAFTCDTVHEILICHVAYNYLVTNFANPLHLGEVVWSIVVEVLFNALTALIVQSFFCFRVFKLSRKNYAATGLVAALMISNFVCCMIYISKSIHMTTYVEIATLKTINIVINVLTAATDAVIALCLCLLLHNSRTGFKQSETMINRLMVFSVNTGLLTSVCAIVSLITITTLPNTFIYICFYFTLGRLYINSLLATLNARRAMRELTEAASQDVSIPLSHGGTRAGVRTRTSQTSPNIAIKIDTHKELSRDEMESTEDKSMYAKYAPTDSLPSYKV